MKNFDNCDVVVLGGPGSGKSTQAKFLVDLISANHLNMGSLLRSAIHDKVPGYEELQQHHDAGTLVPDEVTRALVERFVAGTPEHQRIVFDGYPRSMEQVRSVERAESSHHRQVMAVYLKLSPEVATERLLKRAGLENRPDDTPEVIRDRIDLFERNIIDILEHYRSSGHLVEVNGDQSIEEVKSDIASIFNQS